MTSTITGLNTGKSPLTLVAGLSVLLLGSGIAHAEFVLNWSQQSPAAFINTLDCQTPAQCAITHTEPNTGEDLVINGQTPFLYERTTLEGVEYHHLVVGRPEDGFAQEVFIQVGAGNTFGQAGLLNQLAGQGADGGSLPNASSSSRGNISNQADSNTGNGIDPLGALGADATFTGNASGNPNRVQMRQLITDGELTVDFEKNVFLDKPNITNTIESDAVRMVFSMDSTGNTYTSSDTPSVLTNTIEHLDPAVPAASAFFDVSEDAQDTQVTAGRFTYTPTTGAIGNSFGGAGGTYTYIDGGMNANPDWGSFFDENSANPWSFPGACPTPGACGPNP